MTNVNLDGFIEVECPRYNQFVMEKKKLDKSPGLKVQVFLGDHTEVVCDKNSGPRCEYTRRFCEYALLHKKEE